ncbi:hypothetical protein [Microbacterium elymi]|uniref:Uncharacterized protein n=1 Tax=Microbacterium elymi TaxID=2909587 RepID=A0ABY5NJN2_9MICO|nr:hypothetical protein [Microbacterium elymi]UUT35363.1 hypothetical protein L2X98_35040 [Microbacterium elymi]
MTAPTAPRSAPVRAVISHPALDGNARGLREAGASCADLRRDAWGHGLAACAVTVTAAGLRVRVDEEERAAVADLPDALVTTTAEPDADPRALWGLPGASQPVMSQPVMSRPVMSRPVMSLRGSLLSTKRCERGRACRTATPSAPTTT